VTITLQSLREQKPELVATSQATSAENESFSHQLQ